VETYRIDDVKLESHGVEEGGTESKEGGDSSSRGGRLLTVRVDDMTKRSVGDGGRRHREDQQLSEAVVLSSPDVPRRRRRREIVHAELVDQHRALLGESWVPSEKGWDGELRLVDSSFGFPGSSLSEKLEDDVQARDSSSLSLRILDRHLRRWTVEVESGEEVSDVGS